MAVPFGPAFSNQDWSTAWVAAVWPKTNIALGKVR